MTQPVARLCCFEMGRHLSHRCDEHPNPHDCPDVVIVKTKSGYGLPIHDGGESFIAILYCPFCGMCLRR